MERNAPAGEDTVVKVQPVRCNMAGKVLCTDGCFHAKDHPYDPKFCRGGCAEAPLAMCLTTFSSGYGKRKSVPGD